MGELIPLEYASKNSQPPRTRHLMLVAIAIAACANVIAVLIAFVTLWWVPRNSIAHGEDGVMAFLVGEAVLTPVICITLAVTSLVRGRRDWLAAMLLLLVMALSFVPLPAGIFAANYIFTAHSLIHAPG